MLVCFLSFSLDGTYSGLLQLDIFHVVHHSLIRVRDRRVDTFGIHRLGNGEYISSLIAIGGRDAYSELLSLEGSKILEIRFAHWGLKSIGFLDGRHRHLFH